MSEFNDLLNEYMGDADALSDISVVVRRLWFYDFVGYPTRMWQGMGRLFTSDGNEWLGTLDEDGNDLHVTPRLQDGRDGSSASYSFSMVIPDLPDEPAGDLYDALRADQSLAVGRTITCYHAIFKPGEALRPTTPIKFYKRLTMFAPNFSEEVNVDSSGRMVKTYKVTVPAKDGNVGRNRVPNRSYTDTHQREYARQMGITSTDDLGCEYITTLANKTFVIE